MSVANCRPIPLALGLLAMWTSSWPVAATESRATTDATAVESVLTRFGTALASGDFHTVRFLTSPDFVLLEEGRVYDLAGAIASAASVLSTGTLTRQSSQFHTGISGNAAWSHYRVIGLFRGADTASALDLIESAVLKRTRSGWQLVLMTTMTHVSTPQAQQ